MTSDPETQTEQQPEFDSLPLSDRISALNRFVDDWRTKLEEEEDPEKHEELAVEISALTHLRAELWLLEDGVDPEKARALADKLMGEGMHILQYTGNRYSEAVLRSKQRRQQDELKAEMTLAVPGILESQKARAAKHAASLALDQRNAEGSDD